MTGKSILIVAAHPDDEVLGCGATAARHVADGDTVHVLIMAEGATSRDAADTDGVTALRQSAAAAAAALGTAAPRFAGLPDNRMDGLDLLDIVKAVEAVVGEVAPDIVYTHHGGDLNVDHRLTHQAVLTACRPQPGETVRAIYTFETPSSTEWSATDMEDAFTAQRYVDVGAQMAAKLAALECYESEMRDFPHARSIKAVEALATLRGSQSGLGAAEAFRVIREIVQAE
ncbi:MAG: PIG-L deacetylase family protein [Alphaproteobacteria bacterium]